MEMVQCLCGREFNATALERCPACRMSTREVRKVTPEQRQERRRQDQQARQQADELARLTAEERQQELRRRRDTYIERAIERMEASISEGRVPALHTTILMGAQYSLDDQIGGSLPDVTSWTTLGWDGWEVVATYPHTMGLSLRNASDINVVYGGGVGGLVDGVHVILRFPVTSEVLSQRRHVVEEMLGQLYDQGSQVNSEIVVPNVPLGRAPH